MGDVKLAVVFCEYPQLYLRECIGSWGGCDDLFSLIALVLLCSLSRFEYICTVATGNTDHLERRLPMPMPYVYKMCQRP
jgi:hypothetical protein